MESSTIPVHWHDETQPVYSVTFQPVAGRAASPRLVTGGGDNNVRIWKLVPNDTGYTVEYLSSLRKHTQAVNVVRFNAAGDVLATAGDDGTVILWTLSPTIVRDFEADDDDDVRESWVVAQMFRSSTSEIYDLAWSPDGKQLASGSMDNMIRIYDVASKRLVHQIASHTHYVQGVAWDPRGEYLASQSADRSMDIYQLSDSSEPKLVHKISKTDTPASRLSKNPTEEKTRCVQMYHSETLQSFFRRLTFSPDGKLLLTPSGVYKTFEGDAEEETNTVFVFTRGTMHKGPVLHLPGLKKPAIAISFSPIIYKSAKKSVFDLPYKMVFAVATQDTVVIYDTDQIKPLGIASNLHYSSITDLAWDKDGKKIIISSADGFCSNVRFENGFGEVLTYEGDLSFWVKLGIDSQEGTRVESPTIVGSKSPTPEKAPGIFELLKKRDVETTEVQQEKKKKRIAPTLVNIV